MISALNPAFHEFVQLIFNKYFKHYDMATAKMWTWKSGKVHQGYQKEQLPIELGQYWCSTLPVTTSYRTTALGWAECHRLHFPARARTRYGFWCSTMISLSEGDIPRPVKSVFLLQFNPRCQQSWWPSGIEWPGIASANLAMFRSSGACQSLELICSLASMFSYERSTCPYNG